MEPVTSIVSTIFKVLSAIAKAERAACRNRRRCRELAGRSEVVSSVLLDARAAGAMADGAAAEMRGIILCRLRDALDDALKLVESCGQRDESRRGRVLSWFSASLNSGTRASRFDDVDKRINNCLVELSAVNSASIEKKMDWLAVAAHDHPHCLETKAGNQPHNTPFGLKGAIADWMGLNPWPTCQGFNPSQSLPKPLLGWINRGGPKGATGGARPSPPPLAAAGCPNEYCIGYSVCIEEVPPSYCSVM